MIKSITVGMLFLSSLFMLTGCDSSSSSSGSSLNINAPASIVGKSFRMTIVSGSGVFAETGSYDMTFSTNTYTVKSDVDNVSDSNGTYTYSANGNTGTVSVSDSLSSLSISFTMVFISNSRGTFIATGDATSQQSGTFIEI